MNATVQQEAEAVFGKIENCKANEPYMTHRGAIKLIEVEPVRIYMFLSVEYFT